MGALSASIDMWILRRRRTLRQGRPVALVASAISGGLMGRRASLFTRGSAGRSSDLLLLDTRYVCIIIACAFSVGACASQCSRN